MLFACLACLAVRHCVLQGLPYSPKSSAQPYRLSFQTQTATSAWATPRLGATWQTIGRSTNSMQAFLRQSSLTAASRESLESEECYCTFCSSFNNSFVKNELSNLCHRLYACELIIRPAYNRKMRMRYNAAQAACREAISDPGLVLHLLPVFCHWQHVQLPILNHIRKFAFCH